MGRRSQTIRNKRKIKVDDYCNNSIDTSEINKYLSKGLSREIKFTIISIFVVTIVMISSAYAIFSSIQKADEANTLTVGTLNVEFSTDSKELGNIIKLNGAYPESDEDGIKEKPYEFKITNSGNVDAGYKIKIVDDNDMIEADNCSDNLLDKGEIRVSVDGKPPFTLSDVASTEYIVETGYLSAGKSKEYSIRVWISDASGNEVLGKHYHGKILIEAQNTSTLCNVISGNGASIGDEIVCGTERFNVISNDGYNINMLAKYNLNVGDSKISAGSDGIQDKDALGKKENMLTYATVEYSADSSNINEYLENYKNYLTEKSKLNSVTVNLLTIEQANSLGCDTASSTCASSQNKFIFDTSYWLASTGDNNNIYTISSDGSYGPTAYSNHIDYGVRPVVTITKEDLN